MVIWKFKQRWLHFEKGAATSDFGVIKINRSCIYCGGVHEEGFICKQKHKKEKRLTKIVKFRSSPKWQKKRQQIKKRDRFLCQICARNLHRTRVQYNYDEVQVHHAVPISADDGLKLDSGNLITLCPMHHAMCDNGKISYSEVKKIIDEQENFR